MIDFNKKIHSIEKLVKQHDLNAQSSISLIASGNVVSPRVFKLMESDLTFRAAEGKRGKQIFPGLDNFYEIEEQSEHDIAKIFHADFADLRPLSGSQANMIVYTALAGVGDTIIVPSISSGSHVSTSGKVIQQLRNFKFIRTKPIPRSLLIDLEDLTEKVITYSPRIVIFGGSVINEWQNIREIIDLVHKHNGTVLYDAAHVAGLIACGVFPNPLDFGVDVMTMTTCKTIPGPSHGWIVGRSDYKHLIEKTVFPGFVSGGHLQEYIGAIVSLYEIMLRPFNYAQNVVEYAQLLGKILGNNGFTLIKTSNNLVTQTHQIICEKHKNLNAQEVERKLADIGILLNVNYLPNCGFSSKFGLRLGTQEITRLGASRENIIQIGELLGDYLNQSRPNKEDFKDKVKNIRQSFKGVSYY